MSSSLLYKAFLIFFLSATATAGNAACQFNCASNCLVATNRLTMPNGLIQISIDASSCKGSAVSWIACMNGACSAVSCDGVAVSGTTKICNNVLKGVFRFPAGTTLLDFQMHDGVQAGNVACSEDKHNCAGGSGCGCTVSGKTPVSGVCEILIPVSSIPSPFGSSGCFTDADCPASDLCAVGKCGTNSVCSQSPALASKRCRVSAGVCDVDDYCDGSSLSCLNKFQPSTFICRTAQPFSATDPSTCDIPELCTGSAATCPPDQKKSAGTTCRDVVLGADGKTCDVAELAMV